MLIVGPPPQGKTDADDDGDGDGDPTCVVVLAKLRWPTSLPFGR